MGLARLRTLLAALALQITLAQQPKPKPKPGDGSGMSGGQMGDGGAGDAATCASRPCAAPNLGDVATITVSGADARSGNVFVPGENVYGPFEAGFGTQQDGILEQLGCSPGSLGHVGGGIDTATAGKMVAHQCGVELPRLDGNSYVSLLDECGGHTNDYHFHERLDCLYDKTAPGHSTQVAQELDLGLGGRLLVYGEFEATNVLPQLDACNGHFGRTPDSGCAVVYHYHVSYAPPFTVGCFGPDADGAGNEILVSLARCREVDTDCAGAAESYTRKTTAGGSETVSYVPWCSCFDAGGSNTGTQALAVFAGGDTVTKASVEAALGACGASGGDATTPVDCVGAWGDWSACAGGVRLRSYQISTHSAFGGAFCDYSDGEADSEPCGAVVSCAGEWAVISGAQDGGCVEGAVTRLYTSPLATESGCPANGTEAPTLGCGTNCAGAWGPYSDCTQNSLLCFFRITYDGPLSAQSSAAASLEFLPDAAAFAAAFYALNPVDGGAPAADDARVGWTFVDRLLHASPSCAANVPLASAEAAVAEGKGAYPILTTPVAGKYSSTFAVATPAAGGGASCPWPLTTEEGCLVAFADSAHESQASGARGAPCGAAAAAFWFWGLVVALQGASV